MTKSAVAVASVLAVALVTAGCTSYYKVTDPSTGRVYYTTEVKKKGSGAATLKDARTGNQISIQNSEVQKIKKEQYNAGLYSEPK